MPQKQMSESLSVGLLLALTGGLLDAYSYLNRGEVFATAETGNIVLLGIHLAQQQWGQALRYVFPILAFAAGVLVAELIHRNLGNASGRIHWRHPLLLAECLVLVLVALLPQGRWDPLANILISFTSAIQVESFRKFRDCSCATTMCTGNLRSGTELLYQYFQTRDRGILRSSLRYYQVIVAFIAGAAVSAVLAGPLGQWSVLAACGLLAVVLVVLSRAEVTSRE